MPVTPHPIFKIWVLGITGIALLLFCFPVFASSIELLSVPTFAQEPKLTQEFLQKFKKILSEKKGETKIRSGSIETAAPVSGGLQGALEAAQNAQLDLQDGRAIEILNNALLAFEQNPANSSDLAKLADIHLQLAFANKNLGQNTAMTRELEEAARINPNLAPSELLFPPSLINLFEQARDRVWKASAFGSFKVETIPSNTRIFINGSFRGASPLRIDRLPVGTHHIFAEGENGSAYQKILLVPGSNSDLRLKLGNPKSPKTSAKKEAPVFELNAFGKQEKWLSKQTKARPAFGISVETHKKKTQVLIVPLGLGKPFILEAPQTTPLDSLVKQALQEAYGEQTNY